MNRRPHRFWQFRLATLLLLILYCAALAAAVRFASANISPPLGNAAAIRFSGFTLLTAGLICCFAAGGMALSECRGRRWVAAAGGAAGGLVFILITGAVLGTGSLERAGTPTFAVLLLWWAVCGAFVGMATDMAFAGFADRQKYDDWLRARRESSEHAGEELSPADAPCHSLTPLPRWRAWIRDQKRVLPAWITSAFLHVSMVGVLALGIVEWVDWRLDAQTDPVLHLQMAAPKSAEPVVGVKVAPEHSRATVRRRHDDPAGERMLRWFSAAFPIRREDDRFRFYLYTPRRIEALNRFAMRTNTKPRTGARVAVSISSMGKITPGLPCHFLVKTTNIGNISLKDVFVFVEFDDQVTLRGVTFGGIQPILRAKPAATRPFRPSNGGFCPGLIAVDEQRNRVIFHNSPMAPAEWLQFQLVVECPNSKFAARALVMCEEGAGAQDMPTFIPGK